MSEDDLLHDVEAEAEPVGGGPAAPGRPAPAGLEDVRQHLVRDGRTLVARLQLHPIALVAQIDAHDGVLGAVLERVADQVGDHLGEAVGIPASPGVAVAMELDAPLGIGELKLLDH